jgi:TRAP-type C4-dicarboxylate transport system permease small subunit
LDRVEALADRALSWVAFAGVLALMLAVAALIVDIATRKSVGFSILGMVDLNQLAQMACVFLVLPLAFLRESHITVDFITDRLPARGRAAIEVLSVLCGAALLAAMLWNSVGQALIQLRQGDQSQTLGIPMIWYWAPLVAGTALSLLAVLLVGARAMRKFG